MTVYIGIDWSEQKHDICWLNEKGEVIRTLQIRHTLSGFIELDQARQALGISSQACVVGLETAHNLIVDFLWDRGYEQVYILPPSVVKKSQGRFRASGARDDPWDARLIADILRTDQQRYAPWQPDGPLTRQIRAGVGFLTDLSKELVRNTNRLRSVLLRYYPAPVYLFSSLDGLIALAFIQSYPTPEAASALSFEAFKSFLREHHHPRPKLWAKIYSRLKEPYPLPNPATLAAYSQQAVTLTQLIEILVHAKTHWLKQVAALFAQHPDREIYAHLPGTGAFLQPALLAKLGDDRHRFPTPAVLQAVAGTCPVTDRSGKHIYIAYRRACDHDLREIVQQWAKLSLDASPFAQAYYRSVRPHCQNENDALRRLGNRWLEVLWRLWQDHQPYDETYHLKQRTLRSNPR